MATQTAKPNRQIRLFIIASLVCLAVVALFIWLVDLKSLHDKAASLNGWVVLAMIAILPLFGAPLSFLYVIGGAKFGHTWGLAVAVGSIGFHLAGSWWIGHSILRRPLDALFRKFNYKKPQIPEGEAVPICLLIALVPGIPYAVKNYMMVLGGARFKPYFWTCLPAHFFTATPGILFGDFSGSMTKPKIIFLCVYAALLIGTSRFVVYRLRKRKNLDSIRTSSSSGPAKINPQTEKV